MRYIPRDSNLFFMLPLSEPLIPYYRFGLFYGIAGLPLLHLTFSVRHLNAIKSTAGRSFLGIKPLPALQQM
jgi:hypothetical protein